MIHILQVPICSLGFLSRFHSATQWGGSCDAESSLFCSSEWLVPFGTFWSSQTQRQTDNSEKHLQQKNVFTAHPPVFFHCGALKTFPLSWSLKSKQPISHFCSTYLLCSIDQLNCVAAIQVIPRHSHLITKKQNPHCSKNYHFGWWEALGSNRNYDSQKWKHFGCIYPSFS